MAQSIPANRELTLLNDNWRFALGHATDPIRDFNFATSFFYNVKTGYADGPAARDFDDRPWREVQLPHDWAIELPFDAKADIGHGAKAIGLGFPATSVGWYRRSLDIPASDLGRRILVQFDGAFREAQVFCNGHFLGRFPSGYDSFSCDLSDVLDYGGKNVLSVRLDATVKEGWFYEGAGIYRNVWLVKTSPIHIARDGVFVTTDAKQIDGDHAASATLNVRAELINETSTDADVEIRHAIIDARGKTIVDAAPQTLKLAPGEPREVPTAIEMPSPSLWSLETPTLYALRTTVLSNGQPIDEVATTFGVRTILFDKDQGFFLNGKHVLIKGTCNHQDHACVGVAVPEAVVEFRLKSLLEMGCNAYRTSHNPPAPELLDLCDRLGILVLDENRQTGASPEALAGLAELIKRDRNHPSVFLWSVGNEEFMVEGSPVGQRITATQRALVHRLDPSRLVTCAISGGWGKGSSNSLDVMGFNYYTHGDMDQYHAQHPDQPCIGSEEASTFSTRGVYFDDKPNCHLASYDNHKPIWGATAQEWMTYYAKRPFVGGAFVWTGFDYRGEPTPFTWPAVSSQFGIIDTCGFPKDNFFYYQACWTDKPMVHLLPHWNWPDKVGQEIVVRCYSNADEVELWLNDQSLGRKPMPKLGHIEWPVKYAPGKLVAKAFKANAEVASDVIETTGAPASVALLPDQSTIESKSGDACVVTVSARDANNRIVPTADNEIEFSISGPGRILGVGSGDPSSHEADCFVEGHTIISAGDWQVRAAELGHTLADYAKSDDGGWLHELRAGEHPLVHRAIIKLPDHSESAGRIFLNLTPGTAAMLNGQEIKDTESVESILHPGDNLLTVMEGATHEKRRNPEAQVVFITPAAKWKRKLFNGLAQIIVESTGPGEIKLSATSGDLSAGKCVIRCVDAP